MLNSGYYFRFFQDTVLNHCLGKSVLDIGTSKRFAKELQFLQDYSNYFSYVAASYAPSGSIERPLNNCDLTLDITDLSLPDASQEVILALEVLEHVHDPFKAASELHRVLRPYGTLIVTTPFLSQYHGKSSTSDSHHHSYPDYWRFTHQGLDQLFRNFAHVKTYPLDGPIEFRLKQLKLSIVTELPLIRLILDSIDTRYLYRATSRYLTICSK